MYQLSRILLRNRALMHFFEDVVQFHYFFLGNSILSNTWLHIKGIWEVFSFEWGIISGF